MPSRRERESPSWRDARHEWDALRSHARRLRAIDGRAGEALMAQAAQALRELRAQAGAGAGVRGISGTGEGR